jgi:HPr kinase/phosphorylase
VTVHATCVRLKGGAGVLLLGKSGSGKSDLALRLIADGAVLVSDDRTELFVERGRLFARAPANLRGLIEVRGIGIVAVPHAARARIVLAAALDERPARLPEPEVYRAPPGLRTPPPPLIRLNAFEASAPAKIALAAAAFERKLFRETAGKK